MNAISQHRALQMDNFLESEFFGLSSDNLWHHWMLLDRSRFLLFLLRSASAHSPPPVQNISPKIKCYSHESTTSICCWREKHIILLAKLHTSKHKHTHTILNVGTTTSAQTGFTTVVTIILQGVLSNSPRSQRSYDFLPILPV